MNHRTVDSSLYDYRHTTLPYDFSNTLIKLWMDNCKHALAAKLLTPFRVNLLKHACTMILFSIQTTVIFHHDRHSLLLALFTNQLPNNYSLKDSLLLHLAEG